MISISDFSLWEWIKVAGSFVLFFGPGLLLLSFYSSKSKFSPNVHLTFAFGLSLGIWIILLIWLQLFNISLNKYSVRLFFSIVFLSWLIRVTKNKNEILNWFKEKNNYYELIIIIFSIFIFIFYAYAYKELVAGMGSDSMHHTLISSLIMKEGQIPKDYGPYAPVVTFSYHFGYHAYIAALSWLSGIPVRLMVVLSGAILMGLASLAGGALSYYLTKKTLIGLLSAAIIGIIYIFPAYSLLWGRFTQLMGTIILMMFITALIYWDHQYKFSLNFVFVIIAIAIGLIFSHYRISIIGILFSILFLTIRKKIAVIFKNHFLCWLAIPVGVLFISAPKLIQLLISRQIGFSAPGVQFENSYFSLEQRLGPMFYNEIQTWFLIGISLVLILVGLIKREKISLVIFLWLILLFIFSRQMIFGHIIDPITLMVSSYVPMIMSLGLGLSGVTQRSKNLYLRFFVLILFFVGMVIGTERWNSFDFLNNSFVTKNDLRAADWIQRNTDNSSLFLVNTYQFPFQEELIIGLDAGYWLPVLAERRTITYPMVYLLEKMNKFAAEKEIIKFHQMQGDFNNVQYFELLKKANIDYYFIGENENINNLSEVFSSDFFDLIYESGGVFIFKLIH